MDLNSRLAQARALRDRGDLAAAEASFSEAVERFPQDASALIDWADVAMRRRDWREAQRRCGLLRERFPEHSFGYVAGARALRDAGDLAAAESLSAGVVERFPQDAGGLIDWADLAMRRRDWPEAQRRCALLRERFSEHSFGYVVGARALRDAGDLAAAESLFAEAVERFPQDAGALIDWADVAMRRRDWSEAQRRCVLLRERFPEHSFGYVVGARALRDAGDLDAAEALFAKAAERFPLEAGALIDWADAAIRRCDWGEAQHRCALVRERFPEHWFGYVAGARALRDAGDLAAAEALFGEAVERFPQDVGIVVDWIDCSARRGDWKEARRRAEEAQKQLPHEWLPVLALMRMLREGGWEDDLSDVIKKALDQFPQRVELLREAAEVARRRDEFAEAVSLLDRVCKIMPEDVTAHMRLADVLVELGDWRRCQQILEATLKSLTSNYDIFRAAAFLATRSNDGVWLTGRWPLLLRHVRANDQNGVEQCLDLFRHFGAEPFRYTFVEWIFNEPVSELPKNYVPLAVRLLYQLQYRALWGEVWEDIRSYAIGRRHEVIDPIESLLIASLCGDPLTEQEAQRLIGFYIMGATSRELPLDVLVMVFGSHNASAELDSALSRLIGEFQQRDLNLNSETVGSYYLLLLLSEVRIPKAFEALTSQLRSKIERAASLGISRLEGVVAQMVHLSAAGRVPLSAPALASLPRRLRICVCISGQLRGYQAAVPTWKALGLDRHETRYVVHTWELVGRRLPSDAIAAIRSFSGKFLEEYQKAIISHGWPYLQRCYPTLVDYLVSQGRADRAVLMSEFSSADVVIEDDTCPPFDRRNNFWKMYNKTLRAHRLGRELFPNCELYIRLRPDRAFTIDRDLDWHEIYVETIKSRRIFADRKRFLAGKLWMGDQFAVGPAELMDIYASAFEYTEMAMRGEFAAFPREHLLHENFAYATFLHGIDVKVLPGLGPEVLMNPSTLAASEVARCLQADIGGTPRHEIDNLFLAAIREDEADGVSP